MTPFDLLYQLFIYVVGGVLVAMISAAIIAFIGKRLFSSWMEHKKIKKLQTTLDKIIERSDKLIEKLDRYLDENGDKKHVD